MSTLFIDCKYGISGDMTLSSLVDLGADMDYIIEHLKKLPIDSFTMTFETVVNHGISGKHLQLTFEDGHDKKNSHEEFKHQHHKHSTASEILQMIENSQLPVKVKSRSLALFNEVARAEGKIHGTSIEKVHFHEVGAMDSIIDFIGVCLALESLNISEILFSRVPTGSGMINIAHGLYPIPAPATAEILIGVPLSDFSSEGELTTPTGAAFAKVLATDYYDAPIGEIEKIGYGIGTTQFSHPNVLRTMILKKKSS